MTRRTKELKKAILEKPEEKLEVDFSKGIISTGSTELDLAISGTVSREGGVPGGIIWEIYGPSGAGKTAILAEVAASAQHNGGDARFADPEARLDKEYSRIYGLDLKEKDYSRPDTVVEAFNDLRGWTPKNNKVINVSCEDSLAALSTDMEMEEADKMGMKRAKDFSEQLRKTCRMIAHNNWLIACSNQERESQGSIVTPGGKAIPYYSSLRTRIAPNFKGKYLKKTKTIDGVLHEKIIGVKSICNITKSSIDVPYRKANVYIVFGYGIHDIWGNLQYLKDTKFTTFEDDKGKPSKKYYAIDSEFATVEKAIKHIEDNDLEEELRQAVISRWHEINNAFVVERKPKQRR